jgi:hypothetical protein
MLHSVISMMFFMVEELICGSLSGVFLTSLQSYNSSCEKPEFEQVPKDEKTCPSWGVRLGTTGF